MGISMHRQTAHRAPAWPAAPPRRAASSGGRRRVTVLAQPPPAAAQQKQLVVQGSCYEEIIQQLVSRALAAAARLAPQQQHLIGIAGCPGSGKSTLAAAVAAAINAAPLEARPGGRGAVLAPMDGFHHYKATLDEMPDPQEAYARRGAPWTFDAAAFVAAVHTIRTTGSAALPSFDHGVGDPVPGDIAVCASQHAVVLVEGNYLFLPEEPWCQLVAPPGPLLDDTWFVDCPVDVAMERVFQRQVALGLAAEVSHGRIAGNDRPNAELVAASKGVAGVLVPSTVPFATRAGAKEARR